MENTKTPKILIRLLLPEEQEGCMSAALDEAWPWPPRVRMAYLVPPFVLGMEQSPLRLLKVLTQASKPLLLFLTVYYYG